MAVARRDSGKQADFGGQSPKARFVLLGKGPVGGFYLFQGVAQGAFRLTQAFFEQSHCGGAVYLEAQ